jgi:DNA repair protein RAD16
MKATLLPFQLEGLFWMRKQEKTIWNGGMLAVCKPLLSLMPPNIILTFVARTRWGKTILHPKKSS